MPSSLQRDKELQRPLGRSCATGSGGSGLVDTSTESNYHSTSLAAKIRRDLPQEPVDL